jgi:phosphopantothenoylcysteine synthetase/decarboxylase
VAIAAAAVADYRPKNVANKKKIKRQQIIFQLARKNERYFSLFGRAQDKSVFDWLL